MKRTELLFGGHGGVCGLGRAQGLIGEDSHYSIEMWIDLFHPVEVGREDSNRGGSSGCDHSCEFCGTALPEFCGHVTIMA
jgi:hypothetical protein